MAVHALLSSGVTCAAAQRAGSKLDYVTCQTSALEQKLEQVLECVGQWKPRACKDGVQPSLRHGASRLIVLFGLVQGPGTKAQKSYPTSAPCGMLAEARVGRAERM